MDILPCVILNQVQSNLSCWSCLTNGCGISLTNSYTKYFNQLVISLHNGGVVFFWIYCMSSCNKFGGSSFVIWQYVTNIEKINFL